MKTSIKGIELLKRFEGFRSKPYLCSAGVPTIGFGATYYSNGVKVKLTDSTINELDATNLLKMMLTLFETAVSMSVKSNINQNQFDALVCFCYNVGVGAFKSSTLLKKVNLNPKDFTIKLEFLKWNKSNGKTIDGLTKRRTDESNLYFL